MWGAVVQASSGVEVVDVGEVRVRVDEGVGVFVDVAVASGEGVGVVVVPRGLVAMAVFVVGVHGERDAERGECQRCDRPQVGPVVECQPGDGHADERPERQRRGRPLRERHAEGEVDGAGDESLGDDDGLGTEVLDAAGHAIVDAPTGTRGRDEQRTGVEGGVGDSR